MKRLVSAVMVICMLGVIMRIGQVHTAFVAGGYDADDAAICSGGSVTDGSVGLGNGAGSDVEEGAAADGTGEDAGMEDSAAQDNTAGSAAAGNDAAEEIDDTADYLRYGKAIREKFYLTDEQAGYIAYTYENDYDGNGQKEAFVLMGKKSAETEDYLFGCLFFVNDSLRVQTLEKAVFMKKELPCQETDGKLIVSLDYVEGIDSDTAVYVVEENEETGESVARRENPSGREHEKEAVTGWEIIPEEALRDRIAEAVDFSENSYEICHAYAYNCLKLDSAVLVQETKSFSMYLLGRKVLIKTAQKNYIYTDIFYTSNYRVPPELRERDFDGDGENELAVITYTMHGTGISVRSMYMADKDENGEWKVYEFLPSDYQEQLKQHFDTLITEDGVRFVFDGKIAGAAEEVEQEYLDRNYRYDVCNQIGFSYTQDGIDIKAEIEGMVEERVFAVSFPGYSLTAKVKYLGSGEWKIEDVGYKM